MIFVRKGSWMPFKDHMTSTWDLSLQPTFTALTSMKFRLAYFSKTLKKICQSSEVFPNKNPTFQGFQKKTSHLKRLRQTWSPLDFSKSFVWHFSLGRSTKKIGSPWKFKIFRSLNPRFINHPYCEKVYFRINWSPGVTLKKTDTEWFGLSGEYQPLTDGRKNPAFHLGKSSLKQWWFSTYLAKGPWNKSSNLILPTI